MEHVQYPPFPASAPACRSEHDAGYSLADDADDLRTGAGGPVSADLTADTPIPGMEVPFTWQASLELNANLYSALGQCNLDKAGIRKIEEGRRSTLQ